MGTFFGPLLLVVIGFAGLVALLVRRLPQIRSHLSASPAPETAALAGGIARPASLTRTAGQVLIRGARTAAAVARGTGRVVARVLRRPPVSVRVPRLAARVRSPFRLAAAMPALRRRRTELTPPGASMVSPPSATAPAGPQAAEEARAQDLLVALAEEQKSAETVSTLTDAPPVKSVEPAEVPAPDAAIEPTSPPAAALRMADGSTRERATGPVLEPHVQERGYKRRKVVGHVRPGKPSAAEHSQRQRPERPALPRETSRSDGTLEDVPALLEKGELAKAEGILVETLSVNPRDVRAYRLLGMLYLKRGDAAQAKEVCEEALRRSPEDVSLFGPLGWAYLGLGQYGKALAMFQRAHDADEQNLEYLEQLLFLASRMDRRPLVRVTAEKILAIQPNHADAKKRLAKVAAS